MNTTLFDTPLLQSIMYWVSVLILKITRWRITGALPDIPKFVMIAAPHTSNWDFPFMLLMAFKLRGQPYWMGKAAIFKKPFGGLFKWLGGLPIDRSRAGNVVSQMVAKFNEVDRLILVIPPSGTRKRVANWKTGFYHIAAGAGVPVVLGFLDYKYKTGGVGPMVNLTGDIDREMKQIQGFYAKFEGKNPDQGFAEG